MNKKHTGAYYTPDYLADFMSNRVLSFSKDNEGLSILEPSVGDGVFLRSIAKVRIPNYFPLNLTALDINTEELLKAKNSCNIQDSEFINTDFLIYTTPQKFSVIIGNPPYIRKNRLSRIQLENCKTIHFSENLSEKSVKNIWTSFLIKSNSLLKDDGILSFVLPADLLQLKFTEEIRNFLQKNFERLEIFTFNNLMFEYIGQDTLILFAYKKSDKKGVFYSTIEKESQLKNNIFTLKKNTYLTNSKIKWSHHFLNSEEIKFIEDLRSNLNSINFYCDSRPGIVTAATNFFIINNETEEKYNLSNYTEPIIQKGLYVNGSVVFDYNDYLRLVNTNLPSKLLRFRNGDIKFFSEKVKEYIQIGEEQELPNRYKCKLRENWFVVPNITKQPQGFFFRRCHLYPKLLKNEANVFVTDAAYEITMKDDFNINSLVFSFYNSLTLAFAEIQGRYYGGGVLELTPNEFKSLPLPYCEMSDDKFELYRKNFEGKGTIEAILEDNDFKILNTSLNLKDEEIIRLQEIRQKLVAKRLRKKK